MQGRGRGRGGGNWNSSNTGNSPWNNSSVTGRFPQQNRNANLTPLMGNRMARPGIQSQYPQTSQNSFNHNQAPQQAPVHLMQQQNHQQQFHPGQQQGLGGGINNMQNKQSNNAFTQGQAGAGGQMYRMQHQQPYGGGPHINQQVQQQQNYGGMASGLLANSQMQQQPIAAMNSGILPHTQVQQLQQQPQQNFLQQQSFPVQNFTQQMQQPVYPQQQSNFVNQQQQQQLQAQQNQQVFTQQWQQWANQGNIPQQMPVSGVNINQGSLVAPLFNNLVPGIQALQSEAPKPPLPPNPVDPPPPPPPAPVSTLAANSLPPPPLPPPPEETKTESKGFGKIISTNLPGLMEIISGKSKKEESKIPGLDFVESSPSPKPPPAPEVEIVDLGKDEADKAPSKDVAVPDQKKEQVKHETAPNNVSTDFGNVSQPTPTIPAPALAPAVTVADTLTPPKPAETQPPFTPQLQPSSATNSHPSMNQELDDDEEAVLLPGTSDPSSKITLKAFDKKFREWETSFHEWKLSSSRHPDQSAFGKYLAQWEAWREQLLSQRRYIIDTMKANRERREAKLKADMEAKIRAEMDIALGRTAPVTQGQLQTNQQFSYSAPNANTQVSTPAAPSQFPHQNPVPAQPNPPVANGNFETRDLSKLIQMTMKSGPALSEQRQFAQHTSQQRPQMDDFSNSRQSLEASRAVMQQAQQEIMSGPPVGRNPFDMSTNTSSSSAPSGLARREQSPPVERVSRQPRDVPIENLLDDRRGFADGPASFGKPKSFANIPSLQRDLFQQDSNSFDNRGPQRPSPYDLPQRGRGAMRGNLRPDYRFQNRSQFGRPEGENGESFPRLQGEMNVNRFQSPGNFYNRAPSQPQSHLGDREPEDNLFDRRPGGNTLNEVGRRPTAPAPSDDFAFFRRQDIEKDMKTESSVVPVVSIDYGHGDADIPISKILPAIIDGDVGGDTGVVTFDYGHSSTLPVPVTGPAYEQPNEEESESYHDRYSQAEEYDYHRDAQIYPPYHPAMMRGRGMRGRRPYRGRGMPPMRGHPRPPFRHPQPQQEYYEENYENGRGRPPPDRHSDPLDDPYARPSGPLFPISDFERPVRIAPPADGDQSRGEFRHAPPRDADPLPPETSPRRGRERDRSEGRDGGRRSSERERKYSTGNRNKDEPELTLYSQRKRDVSPDRRRGRSRSRSRSPRGSRERERRVSSDRKAGGRRHSPLSSSSSSSRPVLVEDILNLPGRKKRPPLIVIVLRGLPGSGKTHVAKLIKDRETELGESAPRILSLDDYFIVEEEKTVKDPVTGKRTKEKVALYEYDAALESKYRDDLLRTFRKTIEAGYFRFIILDCVNDKYRHFQEMTNFAKAKKFHVYVVEMEAKAEECAKKNVHNRTLEEIREIEKNWEKTPSTFTKLDVRTLLQDEVVQHVEMEDVSDTDDLPGEEEKQASEEEDDEPWAPSKWETSEDKLNKLDGFCRMRKAADSEDEKEVQQSMEQWLQTHLPEDYSLRRETEPGKKRVRWADIEARREQERAQEIGFVVGQTDWSQMIDPSYANSALTRTKYF